MLNKKGMAKTVALAIACIIGIGVVPMNVSADNESGVDTLLTGKTSMEITQMMGKGWNLGNTFDAEGGNRADVYSQEQSWGNPKVTKELIDGVKAAGFQTIRIPVTWYPHITKEENYKIDEDYLNRVQEIVDYAYENELFVILNVHHEKWVNDPDIDKNYETIGEELVAVWKQLADHFAEYDQHLIFEGMNEPRAKGTSYEWNGTSECYAAVNYLDQLFVETIRDNGKGYNGERALMVPGYAASSNPAVLKSIQLPEYNGSQAENLIVSVHCYSPYEFCLSDDQTTFNPNNSGDTSDITSLMTNLNTLFLKNNIPVVIGECGATNSQDNVEARKAWFIYFGEITSKYGIPAILWDNGAKGNSGGECHNYFERTTGEMAYPQLLSAFIYGDLEANLPKDLSIDFEPYKDGESTVLATPEQYGFIPKFLTKKAKINHTPDAAVGFSMAITKNEEKSTAALDLAKFSGKAINVQFYLKAENNETVTISMMDGETKEITVVSLDSDWTKVSFSYKFAEADDAERQLIIKGTGSENFYLDDMTLTMVEDDQMVETVVGKESEDGTSSEEESELNRETNNEVNENDKLKNGDLAIACIFGLIILLGGALALRKIKK